MIKKLCFKDLNEMKEGSAGELLLHALNQAVEKVDL